VEEIEAVSRRQVRSVGEINLMFPGWFLGTRLNTRYQFTRMDSQFWFGKPMSFYTAPRFIVSSRPRRWTDITIATQCSISRLDMIADIARSWDGVISLAIYIQHPLTVPFLPDILQAFFVEMEGLNPLLRLDIHLLFGARFTVDIPQGEEAHPYDFAYPVNALRNLALDHVHTEFVLNMDCDFVPSSGMHTFLTSPEIYDFMMMHSRWQMALFVIPAFELLTNQSIPVPVTRNDLDEACKKMLVMPFHARLALEEGQMDPKKVAQWCAGRLKTYQFTINDIQGPTNYHRWLTAHEPYPVSLISGKLNRYYEPYFLGVKSMMPRFDERFRGYSFNKRAHMIEMQYAHFEMFVLPEVFITHRYHDDSIGKQMMLGSKVFRETVKRTYEDFMKQVKAKYPPNSGAKKMISSLSLSEFFI